MAGSSPSKTGQLLFYVEGEKDSFPRHAKSTPMNMLDALERMGGVPDVVAMGGSYKEWFPATLPVSSIGVGYYGADQKAEREGMFCGKRVKYFSGSHIRGHIMMGAGMAPRDEAPLRAMLCWEGYDGSFYLLDERWEVVREIPVLFFPGGRYAKVFAIAEPYYPDSIVEPGDDAGKLMALAAYADPNDADPAVVAAIDRLMSQDGVLPRPKATSAMSPFYNTGVESDEAKSAAALIHHRHVPDLCRGGPEGNSARHPPVHIRRMRPQLRLERDVSGAWPLLLGLRPPVRQRLGFRRRNRPRRAARDHGGSPYRLGCLLRSRVRVGSASPIRPSGRDGRMKEEEVADAIAAGSCRGLGSRAIRAGPKSTRQPIPAGRALPREHEGPSQRHQAPRGIPPHRPVLPARGRSARSTTRDFHDPVHASFPAWPRLRT